MEVRGTGTTDTTTAATLNIKNNAVKDTSAKLTVGLKSTNVVIDSNYFYKTPTWGSTTQITITNPKADAASALEGAK